MTANGEYSGFSALKFLYTECFQVANLIARPAGNHYPAVHNALIRAGTKLNGHWDRFSRWTFPCWTRKRQRWWTPSKRPRLAAAERIHQRAHQGVLAPSDGQHRPGVPSVHLAIVELMRAD